jgi:CBS domain-containing protein
VKTDFKTATDSPDQILLYFARTPLEQISPRPTTGSIALWKDFDVVGFQYDERVPRVFAKLVTEGFLSGPVLDENRRYVDMIDMLDLVSFAVDLFGNLGMEWTDENWEKFMQQERKFVEARTMDVLEYRNNKRPRTFPVYRGASLLQALEVFANTDIHRIPVLNRNQRVVGMVTQSMVVSLLTQNVNLLGKLKDAPVSQMEPILAKELLSVREDQKAIDAFRIMSEKNVSGVAVLDDKGLLVDTLSIRDLRGIGTNASRWRRLHLTVKEYKAQARIDYPTQTPREVLNVTSTDTIHRVIELMDDGNIHRVFLVDQQAPSSASSAAAAGGDAAPRTTTGTGLKPKSVITQGDLLRFLAVQTGLQVKFEDESEPTSESGSLGAEKGRAEAMDVGTPRPRSDSTASDVEMRG